jgi:type IV secretion system protein VirD4
MHAGFLVSRWLPLAAGGVFVLILLIVAASRPRGAEAWPLAKRVRMRRWPGPGFDRGWRLRRQHGLATVRRTATRTRPSLTRWQVRLGPWQQYATFNGWAHGRFWPMRVYSAFDQLLLVIAPPQWGGKSAAAAGRIIDAPGPVVSTSIRGDLIKATAGLRRQHGQLHVYNPEGVGDVGSTFRWDPVDGCQDMMTAARRASSMMSTTSSKGLEEGTFWQDLATDLLTVLMHAAALAGGTLRDVYRWAKEDTEEAVSIVLRHPHAADTAAAHLRDYMKKADRTKSGISTTVQNALRFMLVPEIAAAACPGPGQGLDFEQFLDSRDTLYLVAADAAHSPIPPLFTCLIDELVYQARIIGGRYGGRCDPPLTLELDEVANIAPVPLPSWATWAAGSGIRIHAYSQSFAQLAARWGQNDAETIWQACGIKIVTSGTTEEALCHKVEDACGQVKVRARHASVAGVREWETRSVLPFADLRELPQGTAVLIAHGRGPVIVRTEKYWRRHDVGRLGRAGGKLDLPVPVIRALAEPIPGLLAPMPPAPPVAATPAGPPIPGGQRPTVPGPPAMPPVTVTPLTVPVGPPLPTATQPPAAPARRTLPPPASTGSAFPVDRRQGGPLRPSAPAPDSPPVDELAVRRAARAQASRGTHPRPGQVTPAARSGNPARPARRPSGPAGA